MLGLFCLILPLFLVLVSYYLVLSVTSLSPEQERWMSYFSGEINKWEKGAEGSYTTLELSHMDDVKRVMQRVESVFFAVMGIQL